MSVSVAVPVAGDAHLQVTQPFQCLICRSRFTRHENLKRHAALHTRSPDKASYSCELCSATFSRRDLCTRHMRRKHPDHLEGHEETRLAKRKRSQGAASVSILGSSVESHGSGTWSSEQWDANYSHSPDSPESSTDTTGGHSESAHDIERFPVDHHASTATATTNLSPFTRELQVTGLDLGVPPAISSIISDMDFTQLELHSHLPATALPWDLDTPHPPAFPDVARDAALSQALPESLSPRDRHYLQDDWCPSASQIQRGLHLYFTYVSHFVPFLHRPTFDATITSRPSAGYLVLSMLSLGYQHGEDPHHDRAPDQEPDNDDSGQSLSRRCFHRARVLLAIEESKDDDDDNARDNISMIQAYLLLEICAVMYLCGADSAYGLKMHPRMISLTRSSGLTQPSQRLPSEPARDLHELWANFRRTESQKRTVLAAHQIDALWYQLLSIPRSLSHLEIKLELPCSPDCWAAPSAEAWAYLQLTSPGSSLPSVQYSDAIRHFLSPEPDADPLPPFDPFGAINIAQFLLSSAREVSGWSAMTGRLSLERLEPLRTSLVALAPYIRGPGSRSGLDATTTTTASSSDTEEGSPLRAVQEATWEIAMIELQIWSPSHTCGIIEGSVDAVLRESARLAAAGQISCGTQHSAGAQPHVDWFLRYLEAAGASQAEAEAPWTGLYAFKAFLIAWQLLRNQTPGAMLAVSVADGDTAAALTWARKVFGRRSRRRVGEMILACLDILCQ